MATIKQIAELSGVSRGTVDRVLNGRGKVRPEVEQRVLETVQKLDYKPNKIGKALAAHRGKQLVIGIVVNGESNSFFDDVLAGARAAEEELRDFNVEIDVENTGGYSVEKQLAALDKMEARAVGGIAIAPINSPQIAQRLNELIDKGVEVVVFNSDIPNTKRLCFVGCDYVQSGKTAAGLMGRLLRGPSPVEVAIVTGSLQMLGHSQRVEGFREHAAEYFPYMRIVDVLENMDNNALSYKLVSGLLAARPGLMGIYFAAAGVGGGALAVTERGASLTVIACDDTPEIQRLIQSGNISATVCQQPFEQGYRPVRLIYEKIIEKTAPNREFYYTENQIKISENL